MYLVKKKQQNVCNNFVLDFSLKTILPCCCDEKSSQIKYLDKKNTTTKWKGVIFAVRKKYYSLPCLGTSFNLLLFCKIPDHIFLLL